MCARRVHAQLTPYTQREVGGGYKIEWSLQQNEALGRQVFCDLLPFWEWENRRQTCRESCEDMLAMMSDLQHRERIEVCAVAWSDMLHSIVYLHVTISKIKIKLKLQLNNVINTQRLKVKGKDTVAPLRDGVKDKSLKYLLYFRKGWDTLIIIFR